MSLTNICFNKCVVKHVPIEITPEVRQQMLTPKLRGILQQTLEIDSRSDWMLTEKETVCLFNCSKSYA